MASSFINQIPAIIHLIQKLKPGKILDIGKGFGKYGFLIHEYAGINNQEKINPERSLKQQSNISIDAVEVDPDLMLPHLEHIYQHVYFGDVLKIYKELPAYELVLMIDIIEHINKEEATGLLKFLLKNGSKIIVSTPIHFFEQQLYESEFENHVSHWSIKDFKSIACVDVQYFDIVLGKNSGERCGNARAVFTGYVKQENGLRGLWQGVVIVGKHQSWARCVLRLSATSRFFEPRLNFVAVYDRRSKVEASRNEHDRSTGTNNSG